MLHQDKIQKIICIILNLYHLYTNLCTRFLKNTKNLKYSFFFKLVSKSNKLDISVFFRNRL